MMKKVISFIKKESLLVTALVLGTIFFALALTAGNRAVLREGQFKHKVVVESVGEYEVTLDEGATAGDALKAASTEGSFQVGYKEYDFGTMVVRLGDKEADDKNFWGLYYNGQMSVEGADALKLKEGDTTEWKYEKIEF